MLNKNGRHPQGPIRLLRASMRASRELLTWNVISRQPRCTLTKSNGAIIFKRLLLKTNQAEQCRNYFVVTFLNTFFLTEYNLKSREANFPVSTGIDLSARASECLCSVGRASLMFWFPMLAYQLPGQQHRLSLHLFLPSLSDALLASETAGFALRRNRIRRPCLLRYHLFTLQLTAYSSEGNVLLFPYCINRLMSGIWSYKK